MSQKDIDAAFDDIEDAFDQLEEVWNESAFVHARTRLLAIHAWQPAIVSRRAVYSSFSLSLWTAVCVYGLQLRLWRWSEHLRMPVSRALL